jgi:acetyl/propionyl-CoA carboxylase alpha subunit
VCLGGKTPQESYLNDMSVIRIAQQEGVNAIHPGIGFLSEHANFALLCRRHGFNFVGPRAKSMELMGNKSNALATARRLSVPVVPGSHGVLPDVLHAKAIANEIGYPVLIKATYGGGGKGMRVVFEPERFQEEFSRASGEAQAAFGNGDVYLEKFVQSMRHVEVQMLRDRRGNTVILGHRDCTVQRDNQKLIEESGSYRLPEPIIKQLYGYTSRIADEIDYLGAGTVEFIFDRTSQSVYFMEMNTRLQVEHAVTEMVTGADIVAEQIRIASGGSIDHLDPTSRGHAMEVRINAERMVIESDGKVMFVPSPGTITRMHLPTDPNVRVIAAMGSGDTVPPYYDSLILQVIAHARSRGAVVQTLRDYLSTVTIEGIYTNLPLMEAILDDPVFRRGDYDTGYLKGFLKRVDVRALVARMESHPGLQSAISQDAIRIENSDELKVLSPRTAVYYGAPTPDDPPFLELGQQVDVNRTLCLMESMKVFENLTLADFNNSGQQLFPEDRFFTVTRILVENGQTVNQGDLLFIVKPAETQAVAAAAASA